MVSDQLEEISYRRLNLMCAF